MKYWISALTIVCVTFALMGCGSVQSGDSFETSSSFSTESVVGSSSSSSSEEISSSSSESLTSSSVYRPDLLPLEESTYRLSLAAKDTSSDSAPIYNVSDVGQVDCTPIANVYRGHDYIEPYEVAAYYQAFGEIPPNYSTDRPTVINYPNKMGRLISVYNFSSGGYGGNIGPATKGGTYYELDIGTPTKNADYIFRTSIVRGAYRLVVLPRNISKQYEQVGGNYSSVVYYTGNHYDSFNEYCNYGNAWGNDFNGEESVYGSRPSLSSVSVSVCQA